MRRMLDTAVQMAHEQGLRVSFDLQRLEDVISRAGVSRSAVYKRWPRKEQFYSQVLLRLAGAGHPILATHDSGTMEAVVEIALAHQELWKTAGGRRALVVELCRQGALHNFETLKDQTEWQIYIALHATFLSLPDNRFQEAMRDALSESEQGFIQRMARFYETMLRLLGFRLRPEAAVLGYEDLASLGGAVVMGSVLTSGAGGLLTERRLQLDPFNTGHVDEWTLPALGFADIILSSVEEDSAIVWDDRRLEDVKDQLERILDSEHSDGDADKQFG